MRWLNFQATKNVHWSSNYQYCFDPLRSGCNNVWFQKISILPPQKGLEIPGRRGVLKSQKFKAMYEAKLEFPEGWGVHRPNPFRGGYGYFLEPHNALQQL